MKRTKKNTLKRFYFSEGCYIDYTPEEFLKLKNGLIVHEDNDKQVAAKVCSIHNPLGQKIVVLVPVEYFEDITDESM